MGTRHREVADLLKDVLMKTLADFEREHCPPVVLSNLSGPPGLCDMVPLPSLSGSAFPCRSMQRATLFQNELVCEPFERDGRYLGSSRPLSFGKATGISPPAQQPQVESEWDCTTVMMRNLPNKLTQAMLMASLSAVGFADTFDFLHLPIDLETNVTKGYAFINFTDSKTAWRFKVAFDGQHMGRFNSSKVVQVTKADVQGLKANYARHGNAHVNGGDITTRPFFLHAPDDARTSMESDGDLGGSNQSVRRHRIPYITTPPASQPPSPQASQARHATGKHQDAHQQAPAPQGRSRAGFCPFCGAAVQMRYQFCQNCGTPLQGVF